MNTKTFLVVDAADGRIRWFRRVRYEVAYPFHHSPLRKAPYSTGNTDFDRTHIQIRCNTVHYTPNTVGFVLVYDAGEVQLLRLCGTNAVAAGMREICSKYCQIWSLFRDCSCLPPSRPNTVAFKTPLGSHKPPLCSLCAKTAVFDRLCRLQGIVYPGCGPC